MRRNWRSSAITTACLCRQRRAVSCCSVRVWRRNAGVDRMIHPQRGSPAPRAGRRNQDRPRTGERVPIDGERPQRDWSAGCALRRGGPNSCGLTSEARPRPRAQGSVKQLLRRLIELEVAPAHVLHAATDHVVNGRFFRAAVMADPQPPAKEIGEAGAEGSQILSKPH
jgi:hypothetical protein